MDMHSPTRSPPRLKAPRRRSSRCTAAGAWPPGSWSPTTSCSRRPRSTRTRSPCRAGNGQTAEGAVLGRIGHMGLTVRARRRPRPAAAAAGRRTEARPPRRRGRPHLERRRDGGARADRRRRRAAAHRPRRARSIASFAFSRRRTARSTAARWSTPSGRALGIITSMAIRGTTVVIPASLAWAAATKVATDGGTKQGFLGVSSMAGADSRASARRPIAGVRPADQPGLAATVPPRPRGLLVGDVIVGFDGEADRGRRGAGHAAARQSRRQGGAGHGASRRSAGRCIRNRRRAS